ncbi:MAG: GSCFA domain-containing protein [Ramlibacter sp.]
MSTTREEVIIGFRLILGRDPDSEPAIQAHMQLPDATTLAAVLLRSPEFSQSPRFKDFLELRDSAEAGGWLRTGNGIAPTHRNVLIFGNCQVSTVGRVMQAMTGDIVARTVETTPGWLQKLETGDYDLGAALEEADVVFVQMIGRLTDIIREHHPAHADKVRWFPPINYTAFHPDCVYVQLKGAGNLQGRMGDYHSAIAFWAWRNGWTWREALTLFNPQVYELLDFHSHEEVSSKVLVEYGQQCGLAMAPLLQQWRSRGIFMHTINHPRLAALADLTAELLRREGVEPIGPVDAILEDTLARFPIWPVYPPVAARLGSSDGSYLFKIDRSHCSPAQPVIMLSLEEFVRDSFKVYDSHGPDKLDCERARSPAYGVLASMRPANRGLGNSLTRTVSDGLARLFGARAEQPVDGVEPPLLREPVPAYNGNPYTGLPDHHFWRRKMEQTPPDEVDPVTHVSWQIAASDKVATAGSCFAQHISRTLSRNGFRYFVAEAGEGLTQEQRAERQVGTFSARYGNIYTARQLVQLFDRAYGHFTPADTAWRRPDGKFVDPFRPQVEPAGFDDEAGVHAETARHLANVRDLFEQMDVFVFTLGLTESWVNLDDGAVFPLAPGVVAAPPDPSRYGFVNFGVRDVAEDIQGAVRRLRGVNSRLRFIFTVSPVPLIATYEDRHVLVSTIESKAILRAAIGQVARLDTGIDYFPSYEIVTGHHTRGKYFGPDLRSVTEEGVARVMGLFLKHYTGHAEPLLEAKASRAFDALLAEQRRLSDVVCDEEAIERHRGAA